MSLRPHCQPNRDSSIIQRDYFWFNHNYGHLRISLSFRTYCCVFRKVEMRLTAVKKLWFQIYAVGSMRWGGSWSWAQKYSLIGETGRRWMNAVSYIYPYLMACIVFRILSWITEKFLILSSRSYDGDWHFVIIQIMDGEICCFFDIYLKKGINFMTFTEERGL